MAQHTLPPGHAVILIDLSHQAHPAMPRPNGYTDAQLEQMRRERLMQNKGDGKSDAQKAKEKRDTELLFQHNQMRDQSSNRPSRVKM